MFMKNRKADISLALKILAALLVLGTYVVIYFLVFAPVVSPIFFSDESITKGICHYQEGDYLSFEKGREFQELIQSYGVESKGKMIDFYYIDNRVRDNPFYGKAPDIYALDIVATPNTYYAEKQAMAERAGTSTWINDCLLYGFFDKTIVEDSIVVVSFCDKTNTIRYVLITDCDKLIGIETLIIRNSNMEW